MSDIKEPKVKDLEYVIYGSVVADTSLLKDNHINARFSNIFFNK